MSYIDALKTVAADPTLQLSPYSELSLIAGRVGLETIAGTTLEAMSGSSLSEAVQNLVMTAGLAAASSALSSFSSVPFVGAVTSVIGMAIEHEMGAEQRLRESLARQAAECTASASAMRPIATGSFSEIVPADLLAPYLSNNPRGAETPAGAEGRAMADPAYMPEIGQSLWLFGYGYALPDLDPGMTEDEFQEVRALAALGPGDRKPALMWWPPPGDPGPSETRRKQFKTIALAIGATRNVPGTDGGIGLWPVLLDILWNTRDAATTEWAEFMSITGFWAPKGGRVAKPQHVDVAECGRVHPSAIRQVAEMRRGWGLTIAPVYAQYQAKAAELREQVAREMARLMAPFAGRRIGDINGRRGLLWYAIPIGAIALGAAAAVYPGAAGAALDMARAQAARLIRRVRP
jgi:hypothetical protein